MSKDYYKLRPEFQKHLDRASKKVNSWPDWKQKAAGVGKYLKKENK